MTLKEKIYNHYQLLLEEKIKTFQKMIADLAQDAQNDAKGSAGDKHETALSMMHLEQEKLNQKVKEALDQKSVLDSIEISKVSKKVCLGSLVFTNSFTFFISQALPKITIQGKDIIALSPKSPLGIQMMSKKPLDEFAFNTINYKIIALE
ncbi:hypothetical protein FIA58_017925 [Flavobacterium jejuense]|uniref:Transcription elongation factor GreA/GreB C-terminal domain-containing protein n=1 Tax=Flavobacterium jejuense TaxID=1544455 RepID=A0ABX0IUK5_9FLAO|nr:hypothetical protein [Flavobacterium jejuense]NHN27562.1 hypothetical protein [Flavobacterium jejuense]